MRVAVLASGEGTNLRSLARAVDEGRCAVELVGVVSDKPKAGAVAWAKERGLETRVVSPKDHPSRDGWDVALAEAVAGYEPDLVVLAGFMRIVGAPMLERFGGRMINVHPSLLPAFPGRDGVQQALDAGVRLAGCTVHLVDEGVDAGPILAQAAVPVLYEDDAESLHQRIQKVEHRLLPAVVDWIATGHVHIGEAVRVQVPHPDHLSALVFPPLPE